MSYCFATCNSGLQNAAPEGDSDGNVDLGSFTCNEDMGGLYTVGRTVYPITLPLPGGKSTVSAKTIAILVKHQDGSGNQRGPREFRLGNSIILNSEVWPTARVQLSQCGNPWLGPIENVFSKSEFVLMVIRNGEEGSAMFRNGVELASSDCTTFAPEEDYLWLGRNAFNGIFKSFAMWNRALSDEEIGSLDPSTLTC